MGHFKQLRIFTVIAQKQARMSYYASLTAAAMSLQMSYYYGQPLVHCYLLHAEWLASEAGEHLDDAGKIRLQEKVIEASLKAAADAQGHLLSMQMPRSKGRGSRSVPHRANPQPEPAPLQSPGSQAARRTATAAA